MNKLAKRILNLRDRITGDDLRQQAALCVNANRVLV